MVERQLPNLLGNSKMLSNKAFFNFTHALNHTK